MQMIGMKRSYPFSIETPPAPAFHFKCHSTYVAPPSRLDEAATCSNRNYVSSNRGFAVIRSFPSIILLFSKGTDKVVIIMFIMYADIFFFFFLYFLNYG